MVQVVHIGYGQCIDGQVFDRGNRVTTGEIIIAILGVILGAEAIWKFAEFLLNRKDRKEIYTDIGNK